MKKLLHLSLSVALPLTLLAGCKAGVAPLPNSTVAEVTAFQKPAGLFASEGKVLSSISADGKANVRVNMRIHDVQAQTPGFRIQSMPSKWTGAKISLHSASANGDYDRGIHTQSLDGDQFDVSGGETITQIGHEDDVPVGFAFDLAADEDGNVYVADHVNVMVRKIAADGTVTDLAVSSADNYVPLSITVDHDGNVYVGEGKEASTVEFRIRKITPDGTITTLVTSEPVIALGLDVDQDGNLYLADPETDRVCKITPDGTVSTLMTVDDGMADPFDVAVDGAGNLYVACPGAQGVFMRTPGGTITNVGTTHDITFMGTQSVALDGNGNLYVQDFSVTPLRKIDTNGAVTVIAPNPVDGPPVMIPFRATVNNDGVVFVSNILNGVNKISIEKAYRASVQFPPLRPSNDYEARVYLNNEVGNEVRTTQRLVGSQVRELFELKSGMNVLEFDVVVNGEDANFKLNSSAAGNVVESNAITKDDIVTFATGMKNHQPGVSKLVIMLDGQCYAGGTRALLGVLEDSSDWESFTWDTTVRVKDSDDGNGFVPKKFDGVIPEEGDVDQYPFQRGHLIVYAYNDRGERVGESRIGIQVYARPEVDVILK